MVQTNGQEPNTSLEKEDEWLISIMQDQMNSILTLVTLLKDILIMTILCFSTDSLHCTKCLSWDIESKSSLGQHSDSTFQSQHHIMPILTAMRWICLSLNHWRQKLKLKKSCIFQDKLFLQRVTSPSWVLCRMLSLESCCSRCEITFWLRMKWCNYWCGFLLLMEEFLLLLYLNLLLFGLENKF